MGQRCAMNLDLAVHIFYQKKTITISLVSLESCSDNAIINVISSSEIPLKRNGKQALIRRNCRPSLS